jgi:hypothetical protein
MHAVVKEIVSIVAMVVLMIGAPSVYAETAYQSGYKHGVTDSNCDHQSEPGHGCHEYMDEPGHGFSHHTHEFINGYIRGYCAIAMSKFGASDSGVTGKDVNFSCSKGVGFSDIA